MSNKIIDTITCRDKKDAMNAADNIGWKYIEEWEFLPGGEVKLMLNRSIAEIAKDFSESNEKTQKEKKC